MLWIPAQIFVEQQVFMRKEFKYLNFSELTDSQWPQKDFSPCYQHFWWDKLEHLQLGICDVDFFILSNCFSVICPKFPKVQKSPKFCQKFKNCKSKVKFCKVTQLTKFKLFNIIKYCSPSWNFAKQIVKFCKTNC